MNAALKGLLDNGQFATRDPRPSDPRASSLSEFDRQIAMIDRAIAILERPAPRLGANVIVVDGRNVDVWVEEHAGEYRASEIDYDEGRPVSMRSSIPAALHDLREQLEAEAAELNGECIECKRYGECDNCDEVLR